MGQFKRGENHPNFKNGDSDYRAVAISNIPNVCSVCGYNIIEVLEVHHKDGNKNNEELSNLDILCPNHHKEYHLGMRKY